VTVSKDSGSWHWGPEMMAARDVKKTEPKIRPPEPKDGACLGQKTRPCGSVKTKDLKRLVGVQRKVALIPCKVL
jgi:hypothetical protein